MKKETKRLLAALLIFAMQAGLCANAFAEDTATPAEAAPPPIATEVPTAVPTTEPTAVPTEEPTAVPTTEPTAVPTEEPTAVPTEEPTAVPTEEPTATPTEEPTAAPTAAPTSEPTATPTEEPTPVPTPETTNIDVKVVWQDGGDAQGIRPDAQTVTLLGSDGNAYEVSVTGENDEWDYTFQNVPKAATYTLEAGDVDGYRVEINQTALMITYTVIPTATEEPKETAIPEETMTPEETAEPTIEPTEDEDVVFTPTPAPVTTEEPTAEPTATPTAQPTATPTAEPTEEPLDCEASVAAGTNVRLAGDGLSEIVLTIEEDARIEVYGIEGDWVRVSVNGVAGYIYKGDVSGIDELVPENPETDPQIPNIRATIFSTRRSVMTPGETVVLSSLLEGTEGYEILLQWQCDKGNGFEDIPGANGDTFSYEASVETLSYSWRLAVYYR